MVTLSLFRHAKSSWSDASLRDFERPLAPRGEKAAPRMGAYIAEHELVPDLVLCSTARRARETLELALASLQPEPEIRYDEALYLASPDKLLAALRQLPDTYAHAMLVGHNPGMHMLAMALIGQGERDELHALGAKYPTAALVVIDFDGGWDTVTPGEGRLRLFVRPRDLM